MHCSWGIIRKGSEAPMDFTWPLLHPPIVIPTGYLHPDLDHLHMPFPLPEIGCAGESIISREKMAYLSRAHMYQKPPVPLQPSSGSLWIRGLDSEMVLSSLPVPEEAGREKSLAE